MKSRGCQRDGDRRDRGCDVKESRRDGDRNDKKGAANAVLGGGGRTPEEKQRSRPSSPRPRRPPGGTKAGSGVASIKAGTPGVEPASSGNTDPPGETAPPGRRCRPEDAEAVDTDGQTTNDLSICLPDVARAEDGEFLKSFQRFNISPGAAEMPRRPASSGKAVQTESPLHSTSPRDASSSADSRHRQEDQGNDGSRSSAPLGGSSPVGVADQDDEEDDDDEDDEDNELDPDVVQKIMQLRISCSTRRVDEEFVSRAPVRGHPTHRLRPYGGHCGETGELASGGDEYLAHGGHSASAMSVPSYAVDVAFTPQPELFEFTGPEVKEIFEKWIPDYTEQSPPSSPVAVLPTQEQSRLSLEPAVQALQALQALQAGAPYADAVPSLPADDRASSEGYGSGSETSVMSPGTPDTPATPYQQQQQNSPPSGEPRYVRKDGIKWPKDRARQEVPPYYSPQAADVGVTPSLVSPTPSHSPASSWCSTISGPSSSNSPAPPSPPQGHGAPAMPPASSPKPARPLATFSTTFEEAPNHRWMRSQFKGRPRPCGYGLGVNREPELINFLREAEGGRPDFLRIYEAARCYLEGHIALLYTKDAGGYTALYYAGRIHGFDGIAGFIAECLLEAQLRCSRIKGSRQYRIGEERYPPYGDNIFHCLARWHQPHAKNLVMTAATLLKIHELQPLLSERNDEHHLPYALCLSSDMASILKPSRPPLPFGGGPLGALDAARYPELAGLAGLTELAAGHFPLLPPYPPLPPDAPYPPRPY